MCYEEAGALRRSQNNTYIATTFAVNLGQKNIGNISLNWHIFVMTFCLIQLILMSQQRNAFRSQSVHICIPVLTIICQFISAPPPQSTSFFYKAQIPKL